MATTRGRHLRHPGRTRSRHALARRLLLEPLEDRRVLAADIQTLGGNEPTVAIHPADPNVVVVAQFRTISISRDGGATFPGALTVTVPTLAGYAGGGGDPSLAFDSQGRLYFSYLASQQAPVNANFFLALFAARIDNIATGTPAIAQNQLIAAETNTVHHDKEWIAVDSNPASPFRDNVYVVWSQLGVNQINFSRSINGGANWSAASPISGAAVAGANAGNGFVWPSHAAVAPNGDLYVGWHNDTCGAATATMTILRDSSGGANLANADGGALNPVQSSSFQSAVTCNVQDASGDEVPLVNAWMQGALQPFILPDPVRPGNVYVVANDDPNDNFGNGDDGDIILARSTDNGNNWSLSTISHAPAGTLQAFTTGTIDELGNIAVSWYDTRRGLIGPGEDGNLATAADNTFLLDLYHTVSRDGGLTFSNDFLVNDQAFDPTVAAPCRFGPQNTCGTVTPGTARTLRIGEYNGIAASNGMVYTTWMDIRGGGQVILVDKFSMLGPFPDFLETNDSQSTATILGSLPKITLRDLTLHDSTDVDFFQYTAQDTGKLVLNLYFDHANPAVNAGTADLTLRVRDANNNVIATGVQSVVLPSLAREQIVIPVVAQERYYIEVNNTVDVVENPVVYDLEIENFAAPVPIAIDLAAADDSGRSDSDNVTNDAFGLIAILADLAEFAAMGIDILTPAEVAASEAGAAVEVFVRGISQGFATALAGSDSTLFDFTFGAGDLAEGLNFVTAAVRIFDGKTPQVSGRSQLSEPLLLTLDTIDPATPLFPNLLSSSDSGFSSTDNVTNVKQPAFDGSTERNAIVRVRAGSVVVGQGLSTSAGNWEITVEPLRDNVYDMTVEVEDLAGNVSNLSAALLVEIDTLAPNTPHLDLLESSDSGRHNDDNITNDNTPDMSATTDDPPATNGADHLFAANFIFRIFDRLENSAESLAFASALTSATQVTTTLGLLLDGIHNLKLEVEDRAGNISHDFLLDVLIDTVAPTGTAHLFPDSDSGIWGFDETMTDLITSDMTPLLYGAAEANALVRAAIDGVPAGTAVAIPLDGDDAFPPPPEFDGNYFLQTILNLEDGEHTIEVFFQDVAGNESPADEDATLVIFVDTQGPKITNVTRGDVSTDNVHSFDGITSVFEPKPSDSGPDPLVHSIVIHFSDLPDRTEEFADYHALFLALAEEEGNYSVKGDHNGNIAIVDVNVTFITTPDDGLPEIAQVELVFDQPLPDDRYTVWVSDNLSDAAGNPLDGESGAMGPFEGNDVPDETPPIFPTGDGEHGGSFSGRFTIDSRPEIGTYALGTIYLDINGNTVWDPEGQDNDYTNRDIAFVFGFRDDRIFAGNFNPAGAGAASGYDKLGGYGNAGAGSAWRWRLDFDHDGVIDYDVPSGVTTQGDPVAGNFSPGHDGDEIGLFNAGKWWLDSGGDNNIGGPGDTFLQGNMRGQPIVGDFDGDGLDDLATWDAGNAGTQFDGVFQFDLAFNGLTGNAEATIQFDIPGVFQKAIAADMNGDGIDDIGLFVSRREGVPPSESAEWFFLISNAALEAHGTVNALNHPFTPVPFGNDLFAQFGDEAALPVVGNFDPPSGPVGNTGNQNPLNPLDVNNDGKVSVFDALLVVNHMNVNGVTSAATSGPPQAPFLDVNHDLRVSAHDAILIINRLNALASSAASASAFAEGEADPGSDAGDAIDSELLAILADDQESIRRRRG